MRTAKWVVFAVPATFSNQHDCLLHKHDERKRRGLHASPTAPANVMLNAAFARGRHGRRRAILRPAWHNGLPSVWRVLRAQKKIGCGEERDTRTARL